LAVLVRNLRTTRAAYWVNVSESSGAGSSGLSKINAHHTVVFGDNFTRQTLKPTVS